MKKKILCGLTILVLITGMFALLGYKNKSFNQENTLSSDTSQIENRISVNEVELLLTEDSSIGELNYKYPKGGVINSFGTSAIITYSKNEETDELLFRILIARIESTSAEEAMKADSLEKAETIKINDINWDVYKDNGERKTYACDYQGDTYAIGFMPNGNIGNLEQDFMNSIKFN